MISFIVKIVKYHGNNFEHFDNSIFLLKKCMALSRQDAKASSHLCTLGIKNDSQDSVGFAINPCNVEFYAHPIDLCVTQGKKKGSVWLPATR